MVPKAFTVGMEIDFFAVYSHTIVELTRSGGGESLCLKA